jgi:hypothetical protein
LKQLLVKAAKLHPVKTRVHREFAEACTVVSHALIGWPDVKLVKEVAEGITRLTGQHRALAQDVRLYIEQHSRGLKHEFGDLAPYRAGVQEQDIDAVDFVAARIVSAVETMRTTRRPGTGSGRSIVSCTRAPQGKGRPRLPQKPGRIGWWGHWESNPGPTD